MHPNVSTAVPTCCLTGDHTTGHPHRHTAVALDRHPYVDTVGDACAGTHVVTHGGTAQPTGGDTS